MPSSDEVYARAARCATRHRHSAKARAETARFVTFAKLCGVTIEPFQRLILLEVFDGRRELLVLIPRGNGKTTLFALVALWHLLTHPAPRVYLAAASRDQADIAFEVARDLVREHPQLRKRVKAQHRKLVRVDGAGFMRVISSDAGRQHGLMPTLALVDELHAHKNGDLYVALKTAMGKPAKGETEAKGQLVTISTAGHDEEEQLGTMRRDALEHGELESGGERLRIARIAGANFCMLEWACTPEEDLTDPAIVKLANPASFVKVWFLEEQINSPGLHPVELATYHANVWRSGIDSWLPFGAWEQLTDTDWTGLPEGVEVFVGVDMGLKSDCGAVVVLYVRERDDEGYITDGLVEAHIFDPADQADGVLAFSTVEQAIRDIAAQWRVHSVSYDPWQFTRSAEMLGNEGLLMLEHPQSDARMVPATRWLREAILAGRLKHSGDETLAAHVRSGSAVPTASGIRLKKDAKAKKRIDGLSGLLMALSTATQIDDSVSVYASRDGDLL
ncbi:MAG TPA: terminase TerL endonuclease subunit [Solirubrobacter sp.]|nr:terminase TerL endonuclease subunit [Solirubrobacter sp.]